MKKNYLLPHIMYALVEPTPEMLVRQAPLKLSKKRFVGGRNFCASNTASQNPQNIKYKRSKTNKYLLKFNVFVPEFAIYTQTKLVLGLTN